jgi:hypothetical protein
MERYMNIAIEAFKKQSEKDYFEARRLRRHRNLSGTLQFALVESGTSKKEVIPNSM